MWIQSLVTLLLWGDHASVRLGYSFSHIFSSYQNTFGLIPLNGKLNILFTFRHVFFLHFYLVNLSVIEIIPLLEDVEKWFADIIHVTLFV